MPIPPDGFRFLPGDLDAAAQGSLLAAVLAAVGDGWFRPAMPGTGRPFSVLMCSLGPLGWVSDAAGGYRYQARHPLSGRPWPPAQRMARLVAVA
jgi:alkylated DNA repair protein (DNA oxidative demethylase)